ncbi:hypothetical protein P879_03137 [Paragonimus westermani]|uniref:Fork-head domain-containing protein n=1 Tax=Paragonimus westermani TaxID=34504 RepID=A0A8T0DHI8_9TREM|nr:hypothetical protein P879_03137 [Paragonimus westermani]
MSASYIHRDPLVLSPSTVQKLSTRATINAGQNEYMSLASSTLDNRLYEGHSLSIKSSPPAQTQVSLQSPKMSPDSTLTHLPLPCTNSMSRFPSVSSGLCASNAASSTTCDSFLRSALANSDSSDRHCVGSSTGGGADVGSGLISPLVSVPLLKPDLHRAPTATPLGSLCRPRAMTTSNASRSGTPNSATHTPNSSSAPVPSSTTPVKKSSRRNPWGSETYSDLITVAIHSYPDQQATLQQIYDFIITHYEYFRERSDPTTSAGWKNSIRHNLSLHDRFTKCPKSSDNTKSSYWRINTEVAARPYVRRRACSMDNTNPKRQSGCSKTSHRGTGGGHRGNRHSGGDKLSNNNHSTASRIAGSTSVHNDFSLCEMRCVSTADAARQEDGLSLSRSGCKPCDQPTNGKLPGYFHYALPRPLNADIMDSDLLSSSCNGGNRWSSKLSPTRSSYGNHSNTGAGAGYAPYDHLASSHLLFDSSDFHSMVGSTDQALVRSRASSLIEHLLRSDHSTALDVRNSTSNQLSSQPYLPNAFLATSVSSEPHQHHHQHPGVGNLPANRGVPLLDQSLSAFLPPSAPQPHPVDMRPVRSVHTARPMSPDHSAVQQQRQQHHHHHLQPLHLHSASGNASSVSNSNNQTMESTFGSHWQNCATQFQMSMGVNNPNVSSLCPSFNGAVSPFAAAAAAAATNTSMALRLDAMKANYDAVVSSANSPTCAAFHNANRLLPFLSTASNGVGTASLSPSTCSSTSSSTRSWRHPFSDQTSSLQVHHHSGPLQTDALASGITSRQAITALSHGRSPGPITPPNLQPYYSSVRQGLSSMFNVGGMDCALDTPPYQQLKHEPLDDVDEDEERETLDVTGTAGSAQDAVPRRTVCATGGDVSSVMYDMTEVSNASNIYGQNRSKNLCPGSGSRYNSSAGNRTNFTFEGEEEEDEDEDDQDKLELELSLELADRIVGSTRSSDSK